MINENKQLLLKDLCARLLYGTICEDVHGNSGILLDLNLELNSLTLKISESGSTWTTDIDGIKPYLRPMSSMTEEEKKYLVDLELEYKGKYNKTEYYLLYFNWLNAHHFDYRKLIDKGLAIEAPEGMYLVETRKNGMEMNKYTIYCNEEQTKKAFELGAPLDGVYSKKNTKILYTLPYNDPKRPDCAAYYIPTAEQIICWLEEQGFVIEITLSDDDHPWTFKINKEEAWYVYDTRKKATLAAIDAALDYLSNNKK